MTGSSWPTLVDLTVPGVDEGLRDVGGRRIAPEAQKHPRQVPCDGDSGADGWRCGWLRGLPYDRATAARNRTVAMCEQWPPTPVVTLPVQGRPTTGADAATSWRS